MEDYFAKPSGSTTAVAPTVKLNSFAQSLLDRQKLATPAAEPRPEPPNEVEIAEAAVVDAVVEQKPEVQVPTTPVEPMDVDKASSSSEESSNESDAAPSVVVAAAATTTVPEKRKLGRKPQRRLPRNVPGLRRMQALQSSTTTIFRKRTTQKIVKHIVRELMQRRDVRFASGSVEMIMNAVEIMMLETSMKVGQSCLKSGRATLMNRHVESLLHTEANPNPTYWTPEDFGYEEARLEPSRFRNSRLHRDHMPK